MDFKQLAATRESCRAYSERPVPKEEIKTVLETALLSPSACNSQPWRFIVCEGETAKKLPDCIINPVLPINRWVVEVPVFLVVCETKAKLMGGVTSQKYAQMDVGIATAALCFAASEQGLSTCILGSFSQKKVKALLGIPKDSTVRLIVTLGYATKDGVRQKNRRAYEELVSYNQW